MSDAPSPRPGHSRSQRGVRMALALTTVGGGWAMVMAPMFGIVSGLPLMLGTFAAGFALLLVGTRAFKMAMQDPPPGSGH